MNNETRVQVPLSEKAKAALEQRADANGRALGREAAQIINRVVLRNTEKSR